MLKTFGRSRSATEKLSTKADETITVALAPHLAAIMQEAIAAADYAPASEIANEALLDWARQRKMANPDLIEVGQLWEEGLQSGPGAFSSIEDIKREARKLLDSSNRHG